MLDLDRRHPRHIRFVPLPLVGFESLQIQRAKVMMNTRMMIMTMVIELMGMIRFYLNCEIVQCFAN